MTRLVSFVPGAALSGVLTVMMAALGAEQNSASAAVETTCCRFFIFSPVASHPMPRVQPLVVKTEQEGKLKSGTRIASYLARKFSRREKQWEGREVGALLPTPRSLARKPVNASCVSMQRPGSTRLRRD